MTSDPGRDLGQTPVSDLGQPVQQGRPRFTLTQVAQGSGRSHSTIKRMRARGDFPNAEQDDSGAWLVPIEDVLAAGLRMTHPVTQVKKRVTQGHDLGQTVTQVSPSVTQTSDPGQDLARELADVRHALELERLARQHAEDRRRAAEALAAAYERSTEDLRAALRMLESRPPIFIEQPAPQPPTAPQPAPVVEQPAPVVEQPAPVVEQPAPVMEQPAPPRETFRERMRRRMGL